MPSEVDHTTMHRMLRPFLLLALLLVLLALVFGWVAAGPLSIDEVTYHRMTHALAGGHGFFLDNGYETFRSEELTTLFVNATAGGRLAAQYPYGAPMLALPFYAVAGPVGMFLVNALAFVASVWLCHRIACQLLRDRKVALLASALLVVSYFSEYALASWPHATSVAATLGAMTLAIDAYQRNRHGLLRCVGAGLLAGVGATLRLDTLFCVPAIAAPFLLASPTRVRQLLAIAVGLMPGGAFIAITNYARWGTLSPVSYGPTAPPATKFLAFGVVAVLATAAIWGLTRPAAIAWIRRRAKLAWLGLLGVVLVVLVIPRGLAAVRGIATITLDLRLLEHANSHSDTSAVIYVGGLKRALLQSCPFLVLALLPLASAIRNRTERFAIGWLSALPLILVAFYGSSSWHGGLCLNMRYLLPALPFLCVLSARGLLDLASGRWRVRAIVLAATCGAAAYTLALPSSLAGRELFLLTIPLVLTAATVVLALCAMRWSSLAAGAMISAGLCVGWSAAATVHDATWSRTLRLANYQIAKEVGTRLPDGALLFVDLPDPFFGAIEYAHDLHIAQPFRDRFVDVHRLVAEHLRRGRGIFAALPPLAWDALHRQGGLRDTTLRPIGKVGPYLFGEIQAP